MVLLVFFLSLSSSFSVPHLMKLSSWLKTFEALIILWPNDIKCLENEQWKLHIYLPYKNKMNRKSINFLFIISNEHPFSFLKSGYQHKTLMTNIEKENLSFVLTWTLLFLKKTFDFWRQSGVLSVRSNLVHLFIKNQAYYCYRAELTCQKTFLAASYQS